MIVDRILQIIEHKGISKLKFYNETGLSNGFLDKVKDVGASKIERILNTYPEINPIWLVMGNGDMIIKPNVSPVKEKKVHLLNAPGSNEEILSHERSIKDMGLPKVVTVREHNTEAISLVPVKAAAGYLNGYSDPEYIENLPTIHVPNLGHGTHRAFEIKGHSMNPTLHSSSVGIGRWVEHLDDIRDRRIYIIVTKTEGVVTKRVLNRVDDTGRLVLISDNSNKREYPNILLDPSDILEIWYLRAVIAFEFPEPDIMYQRVNDLEAKFTVLEDKINRMAKH